MKIFCKNNDAYRRRWTSRTGSHCSGTFTGTERELSAETRVHHGEIRLKYEQGVPAMAPELLRKVAATQYPAERGRCGLPVVYLYVVVSTGRMWFQGEGHEV